ncbi:MAG TPA: carboxypeptidase regulatory-like domain-containing protein [Candidatus Acidoferrales bacterium]|jgi:plastocyanin|nr:carboxypeptidase regulatory-like domain-containing protein [Candidatus Acidoferrales bacterium]
MQARKALLGIAAVFTTFAISSARPQNGIVSGRVSFEGTPAKPRTIDMSQEPSCAKQYDKPVTAETVVTGPENALENVVVYVSGGAPDEPPPAQPAVLTQKGCRYSPHILAFQVNQDFEIVNDDQTSHNIHPQPSNNREWNKSQPPGAPPIEDKYARPEFIPVKCNIHPWMKGTLAVMKNSHYAITAGDGEFKLPNLPPGAYTITAWHESYGEQTQEVIITGSESKTVNFVFKAKPY